jgi:hypothetical protein
MALEYARKGEKRFGGKVFTTPFGQFDQVAYGEALAVMVGNYYHIVYDYPGTPEAAVAWQRMRRYGVRVGEKGAIRIVRAISS